MQRETQFQDEVTLTANSSRTLTGDGYLVAPAVLARAGVFNYRASELGIKNLRPDTQIAVYRSADALAKAVETFESQTITLDHKWTTAANWRNNAIGDVREVEMNGDTMVGVLIVRDTDGIKAIDQGTSQLSNGYRARIVHRPGKYKGMDYEYEQTDFHGNHIAIVDRARCGSECRIGDSDTIPNNPTKEHNAMITRAYDGLTLTLENEQSGQIVDRLMRDLADTRKDNETLKAAVPKFKIGDKDLTAPEVVALIAGKDGEIKTLKDGQQTPEQVHAMVVARSNAITSAREMVADLKIDDKDSAHDIRLKTLDALTPKDETVKAMLDAALGGVVLKDAQPAVVEVAFATIAAGLKRAKDTRKVTDSRSQIGSLATVRDAAGGDVDPRTAYKTQLADAWKGPQAVTSKTEVN